jgi:hypothetical protein
MGWSRRFAIGLTCIPVGAIFLLTLPLPIVGQGGAVPMFFVTGPLLCITIVVSPLVGFLVEPKRARRNSAHPETDKSDGH